jgi:flagellin
MAQNAQRNLSLNTERISKSMEKLSSGLRINRAADDPAGIVMSEALRAQVSGLDVVQQNVSEAVNLVKTAEGALSEVNSLLRQIQDLALDSASDSTNTADTRAALQAQLDSALKTIDSIAANTKYAGINLLDGNVGNKIANDQPGIVSSVNFVTTGFTTGDIEIDVTTAAEQARVTGTTTYTSAADTLKQAGSLYINDTFIADFTTADTVQGMIDTINAKSHLTGAKAEYVDNGAGGVDTVRIVSVEYGASQTLKVVQVGATMFNNAAGTVTDAGVDVAATVTIGGTAHVFGAGDGLQLKDAAGNTITLSDTGGAVVHNLGTVGSLVSGAASFQTGLSASEQSEIVINAVSTTALGVAGLDVTNATSAQAALATIGAAIDAVSTLRGRLGAFQANELESQGRSLATARENIAASESAIRDTDFGSEMAEFSTAQILVQSATSFLAQANSLPQNVLSLIRG